MVGTEMVRAFPRPSSSDTLNGSKDASIGNAADVPTASIPLITSARSLLKSAATNGRLFLEPAETERSGLLDCGRLSGIPATNFLFGSMGTGAPVSTGFAG